MVKHGKFDGKTNSTKMPYIAPKNHQYKEKLQQYLENKRNTMSNEINTDETKKKKKQWKKKSDIEPVQVQIEDFEINDPPLKSETVKVIKGHGTFTYLKHEAHKNFVCNRCKKEKKSKNVIKWTCKQVGDLELCNGCYGEVLASIPKDQR